MSAAAGPSTAPTADRAERSRRYCETVTRQAAANFYWGIRLLGPAKRAAMCAVYAYARRIDDIGDGDLPAAEKLRLLTDTRERVARLVARQDEQPDAPRADDEVMAALADACCWFPLPRQSLIDLIDGVEMDVRGETYETIDELVIYCRRVAGSIGRLCFAIFGCASGGGGVGVAAEHGGDLADDLGVAMQLTNILRDVREDALNGRVYLPLEDLRGFAWVADGQEPVAAVRALVYGGGSANGTAAAPAGVDALVHFQASRARDWFGRGMGLVELLDRRSTACVLAMTGIYRRVLELIDEQPERVTRERVSLPAPQKVRIAVTSMLGALR